MTPCLAMDKVMLELDTLHMTVMFQILFPPASLVLSFFKLFYPVELL